MPNYNDPLWTVIVLTMVILAGVWAHSRHNKPSGSGGACDAGEPKIGSLPPAKSESAPHEQEADNGRNHRNQYEGAIRNWTAVLAVSGVFAAIFAAFTLGAIRGQLEEMRNAGKDTKRAIDATNRLASASEDSAKTARDTEQRQLRAYVFPVVSLKNVNGDVSKTETDPPTIEMIIKNNGRTPAYEISLLGLATLDVFPAKATIRYERVGILLRAALAAGEGDPAPLPDLDSRTGFRHREWQKCWRLIKPGQKCGAKL